MFRCENIIEYAIRILVMALYLVLFLDDDIYTLQSPAGMIKMDKLS